LISRRRQFEAPATIGAPAAATQRAVTSLPAVSNNHGPDRDPRRRPVKRGTTFTATRARREAHDRTLRHAAAKRRQHRRTNDIVAGDHSLGRTAARSPSGSRRKAKPCRSQTVARGLRLGDAGGPPSGKQPRRPAASAGSPEPLPPCPSVAASRASPPPPPRSRRPGLYAGESLRNIVILRKIRKMTSMKVPRSDRLPRQGIGGPRSN
jgi:hypothetical protein